VIRNQADRLRGGGEIQDLSGLSFDDRHTTKEIFGSRRSQPGLRVIQRVQYACTGGIRPFRAADDRSALNGHSSAIFPHTRIRRHPPRPMMSNRVQRSLAQLAGGFSLLALVLASIGIYGMMAYAMNIRTGEIGLRIAPGARASQVLSRVLREAFWVTGAGSVLGLIAALWLMRFIRVMLYSIAGTDALTVGGLKCG
jgi:predicted lysophospholipase L1 biosynthesis ABC-type transport system permease subunit